MLTTGLLVRNSLLVFPRKILNMAWSAQILAIGIDGGKPVNLSLVLLGKVYL